MSDLNLVVGVIAVAAIFIGWTAIELIGRLLARQRETIQREADTSLQDMFIFIDPSRLFMFNTIALFAVPVVLWLITENPIVSLGAAIAIVLLPRLMVSHLRKKRMRTFERQLPDALLMISGSLRAGASLTVALESMVAESKPPVSQEFELMLREQRVGVDFDTALKNMEKRIPNCRFRHDRRRHAHLAGGRRKSRRHPRVARRHPAQEAHHGGQDRQPDRAGQDAGHRHDLPAAVPDPDPVADGTRRPWSRCSTR